MSIELEYAPSRRRRAPWRWVLLGVMVIVVGLGLRHRGALWAQGRLRWTVGECRNYVRPADSVALEANVFQAGQLIARDGSYVLFPGAWPMSRNPRFFSSLPLPSYSWHTGEAYKSVPPWEKLSVGMIAPGVQSGYLRAAGVSVPPIVLFVHERRCKDRPLRLVAVELNPDGLMGYVIDPGNPWQKPRLVWQGSVHNLGETIMDTVGRGGNFYPKVVVAGRAVGFDRANPYPARIYFGQIDAADSSKFTLRVEIARTDFMFEGRLLADDTVEIEGPLLSEVFEKLRDKQ